MGEEITTIDISNAEVLSASSFTNVKNSIDIKIDNLGNLTDVNDNAVTMLNFGDRGDHCVTVINAELPSNFSEGYLAYFLVDLKNKTYIQKCLMEGNIAKALITKEISLDSQSTECLFALIEASATTGNLREQQEIFVSEVFMGTVRSNFLDSNWMDADISVSEDLTVLDKFETPNPDKYTSMVWVNGETKLNAANMNNIIKGIDELKEQAVAANPTDDATATLSKLKVGSTTYGIGSDEIVEANGTFQLAEDETGTIINTISFDNNIAQKIKEGKIKVIYGYLQNCEADNDPDYFYCTLNRIQDAQTNYPTYYYRQTGNDSDADIFTYVIAISFSDEEPYFSAVLGKLKNGSLTPSLPSDASSKTYTLRSVNGTIDWKDTSVGTQKFENVEVSGTITAGGKSLNTVEANPSDAATTSLNKIKIGNTAYNITSSRALVKNGTYYSKNGELVFNTISLTDAEITQINNKEIDVISGKFVLTAEGGTTDYCVRFNGSNFVSTETHTDSDETYVDYIGYTVLSIENNQATIGRLPIRTAFVPKIPAENNKILVTNNGKLVYEDKPNKSNSTLKKDGTFKSQNGPIIINSINFTDEELERINNREIDSIYGSFDAHGSKTEYRVFFSAFFGDLSFQSYNVDIDSAALDDHRRVTYTIFTITILEGSWVIVRTENDAAYVPSAPSTNNKTLVTDNGYLKYVDMPDPVIANPSTTPTETIKTIKIGKTTYYIAGSSGSGGSGGSSGIPDLPEDAATKRYVLSNSTIGGTNVPTWIENTYNGHMTENQLMSYVDESSPIGMNVSQMRSDLIDGKFLTMIAGDGGLSFISDLYDETKSHGISMLRVEDGYMEQSCIYKNSTEEELANSMNKKYLFVPDLPTDASSINYTLRSDNGTLAWANTSVGTQKFENVEVSGTITLGGKKINDSYSLSLEFNTEDMKGAVDNELIKSYTKSDSAELNAFLEGQNGKILASLITPIGTINITLYPCSFGGVMYSFQGLMNISTNLSSIGGKPYSTMFVSLNKLVNTEGRADYPYFSIRLVGIGA